MVHTRFSSPSGSQSGVSGSSAKPKPKKMKLQRTKLASKPKKVKLRFRDDLPAPPQGLTYEVPLEKHITAKISTLNKYDPITELRSLLSKKQLAALRKSCFGHLMDLPTFKLQNQLIHNLLLRQIKQPNVHELWICVGGKKLKFGLKEFATVSGLTCAGDANKMRFLKSENSLVSRYFEGNNNICKSSLKTILYSKQWKSDVDAVKIAKLYLLHHFLLTSSSDSHIPKCDLDLLDSEEFDEYPWGKEVFIVTLESLKNSVRTNSKDNYYRLNGFPYALQLWFYECCPYLNGKYCSSNGSAIPRALNWTNDCSAKFEEMYSILSMDSKELQLKGLTPTSKEIEVLHLTELMRNKDKEVVITEVVTYSSGDDDFVDPLPRTVRSVSKTSDSSKSDMAMKKVQRKIVKLESSQKELQSEVADLKYSINELRSYFDEELVKLRDMFMKKVGGDREEGDEDVPADNVTPIVTDEAFEFDVPENENDVPDNLEELISTKVVENNDNVVTGAENVWDDFSPDTMEKLEVVLQKMEDENSAKKLGVGVSASEVAAEVANAVDIVVDEVTKKVEFGDYHATDNVGEPVVGGVQVSVPEAGTLPNTPSPVNADIIGDVVLHVAHEVANLDLGNENTADMRIAFQNSNHDEMKDSGVHNSKVTVLRNAPDTSQLSHVTPAKPRRAIRLPMYLRSPFLQHFGSSSAERCKTTEKKIEVQIWPLDDNIDSLPDLDLTAEYFDWLDHGLLVNNKRKFYSKEDNLISPPMKLGLNLISEKTWFHTIEYSSVPLSSSHVDVFLYYLRKKSKYNPSCTMKFTTTDTKFMERIKALYSEIRESNNVEAKISADEDIIGVINGTTMPFGTAWSLVDNVLFPIWLPEQKYWLLAVLNFSSRQIRVCNTYSRHGIEIIKEALIPISELLPHYLVVTDFYARTDIDFSAKCYTEKSQTGRFVTVAGHTYPYTTSGDSGIYMMALAEFLTMDKELSNDSFDEANYRTRIAFSFYSYAMGKQIYGYESETEYNDDLPRGNLEKK